MPINVASLVKGRIVFYKKSIIFTFISVFLIPLALSQGFCPHTPKKSIMTFNNMGKSSFEDQGMERFLEELYLQHALSTNKPVAIFGAGYGAGLPSLIRIGVKTIYLNDLSSENLFCVRNYLEQNFPKWPGVVNYLKGDVTNKEFVSSIPDNNFGLVYAKNLVQFLTPNEIYDFFNTVNKKLEKFGFFIFVFENPILENELEMRDKINREIMQIKHKKPIDFDKKILIYFNKNSFGRAGLKCSIKDYFNTEISIRAHWWPCSIHKDAQHITYLLPEQTRKLLLKIGFNEVEFIRFHDEKTYVFLAKK